MAPNQMTLATQVDVGFAAHRKATRRDVFLAEMDKVVPWDRLCALIEPHYPKVREGEGGRCPTGLERMLRIHFLKQWYALSDPGVEEVLHDSEAIRRFVGIDLGREGAPDESTVLQFRHLLERRGLASLTCPYEPCLMAAHVVLALRKELQAKNDPNDVEAIATAARKTNREAD